MRRSTTGALAVLILLAAPATAGIVDQSQLSENTYMASFSQPDLAQSFMPSLTTMDGAAVKMRTGIGSGTADITIELWDLLPNVVGANLLATGTDLGVLPGEWAVVSFAPVPVVPDTTYYLVFTSTNSGFGLGGDTTDPYSRGMVFANAGFGAFPSYDYTFETYGGTAIPEPSSFVLLGGGGLLLLAARARSRRRVRSA